VLRDLRLLCEATTAEHAGILDAHRPPGRPIGMVGGTGAHAARTAGELWNDHDLVFATKRGTPIERTEDWREWKVILKRAGARNVRVHDTRHTAGTMLIEQGVNIRVVQEVLGHTRVTTTERYTHVAAAQVQDAGNRMGVALWGER
jgi:integrase